MGVSRHTPSVSRSFAIFRLISDPRGFDPLVRVAAGTELANGGRRASLAPGCGTARCDVLRNRIHNS